MGTGPELDFEQTLRHVYEAVLEPGACVIDIGAHVGSHAGPIAAAIAPGGLLYAIEPLAEQRFYLREVLVKSPLPEAQWHIFDCAMGQAPGLAEFCRAVDAPAFSGLRERRYDLPTRVEKFTVVLHSLDELFMNLPRLDYIKIDVEGGEYHVLRGGVHVITKYRPLVSFEFGACAIEGYGICCEQMGEYWLSRNYRLCDVAGHAYTTPEAFADSARRQDVWDYVAIPAERREWLEELSPLLPGLEDEC